MSDYGVQSSPFLALVLCISFDCVNGVSASIAEWF